MKKLLPKLDIGDTVQVINGFTSGRTGEVIIDDNPDNQFMNKIKIEFPNGWVGWQSRSNLRIIKRINKGKPKKKE